MKIREHICQVENMCQRIENGLEYYEEFVVYLAKMNEMIMRLLRYSQDETIPFQINEQYVLQVVQDLMYGIEHQDKVILLDTLRYGLLPIYGYVEEELGGCLDE